MGQRSDRALPSRAGARLQEWGQGEMCLNPILLPNGQQVACHKCWQCVRTRIDDWSGRCIAESQTAAGAHCVTLTYGRDSRYDSIDHLQAAVLTYSDIRLLLKRVRKSGLKVRYFIVGEYGKEKGRAHWHCLLFWQDAVPIMELGKNVEWRHWPHGHTFWDRLTPETIRYVCKYIAKETVSEERAYHMGMSRMPPLGDQYFRWLAGTYVEARLAPQDFEYSFAGVEHKGRQKRFRMRTKTRENFLRYYRDQWWERWGDHPPNSEILETFEDKEAEAGNPEEARRIIEFEKHGVRQKAAMIPTHRVSKPAGHQLRPWMRSDRLVFSEMLNVWLYDFEGGQRPWYWAKDELGEFGWRTKIGVGVKNDLTPSYAEAKGRR